MIELIQTPEEQLIDMQRVLEEYIGRFTDRNVSTEAIKHTPEIPEFIKPYIQVFDPVGGNKCI